MTAREGLPHLVLDREVYRTSMDLSKRFMKRPARMLPVIRVVYSLGPTLLPTAENNTAPPVATSEAGRTASQPR